MPKEEPKDRILNRVGDGRRDFVKRVLVGARFAAPVITSFAIGSLGVESALARESSQVTTRNVGTGGNCAALPDPGYVGPKQFRAFVIDACTQVNGEMTLDVHGKRTIKVDLDMVKDAKISSASLNVSGGSFAIPLNGNSYIQFSDAATFHAILRGMAAQQATVSVQGTFTGTLFNAQGPVVAGNAGVIDEHDD